jgi:hypothetical protein
MSLLVIRVLYVVFDGLAHTGRWLAKRFFGLHDDQVTWLFGEDFDAVRSDQQAIESRSPAIPEQEFVM